MQSKPRQFTLNNRDYMLGTAPVEELGYVAVALPLPDKYMRRAESTGAERSSATRSCGATTS